MMLIPCRPRPAKLMLGGILDFMFAAIVDVLKLVFTDTPFK